MSILNVVLRGDYAFVASDSLGKRLGCGDSTPIVAVSKFVPLPHANAVIGVVGDITLLTTIFSGVHYLGGGFDSICEKFRDLVGQGRQAQLANCAEYLRNPLMEMGSILVLVGWSESRGRVWGLSAERKGGAESWEFDEIDRYFIYPYMPEIEDKSDPKDREEIADLCEAQVRLISQLEPDFVSGGQMILAEITKGRISIDGTAPIGVTDGCLGGVV